MRKNTNVPATVVYFFVVSNSYLSWTKRHAFRKVSIRTVWVNFPLSKQTRRWKIHRPAFLCVIPTATAAATVERNARSVCRRRRHANGELPRYGNGNRVVALRRITALATTATATAMATVRAVRCAVICRVSANQVLKLAENTATTVRIAAVYRASACRSGNVVFALRVTIPTVTRPIIRGTRITHISFSSDVVEIALVLTVYAKRKRKRVQKKGVCTPFLFRLYHNKWLR